MNQTQHVEITSPTLKPAPTLDELELHELALEWSLAEPIVIDNADDIKSRVNWQDRLEPYHHQVQNLMTFCRRLPVSLSALADRMLTAFRESPAVTSDDTVIGIEQELRGELIPGVPDLLARIDLLTTTSDALVITDFKTARSRWSQGQAENSSSQLLLYSELARRLMPDRDVRLRFLVLTKTKSPTVESFDVDVSQHRVRRITKAVEYTWRAIQASLFYPVPSTMNCSTCPFRSECNAWTG